jgi:hypothetical protein
MGLNVLTSRQGFVIDQRFNQEFVPGRILKLRYAFRSGFDLQAPRVEAASNRFHTWYVVHDFQKITAEAITGFALNSNYVFHIDPVSSEVRAKSKYRPPTAE